MFDLLPDDVSSRVIHLFAISVERVLNKASLDASSLGSENIRDIAHIVDWLIAADLDDASWLYDVDEKGRPKKLIKCGNLDRLTKEANKAMLRKNQQNAAIIKDTKFSLCAGEEVFLTLDDGWFIVEFTSVDPLRKEGVMMGNCIGSGRYDTSLLKKWSRLFSLRDPKGKSKVSIEIRSNRDIQMSEKGNNPITKDNFFKLYSLFEKINMLPRFWSHQIKNSWGPITEQQLVDISQDPYAAYEYVKYFYGGRWEEGESAISKDTRIAYYYAEKFMRKSWADAEPAIMRDPYFSAMYADKVLKSRWILAEPSILASKKAAEIYTKGVMKGSWIGFENTAMRKIICEHRILQGDEPNQNAHYIDFLKHTHPEEHEFFRITRITCQRDDAYEKKLLGDDDYESWFLTRLSQTCMHQVQTEIVAKARLCAEYATLVIKNRWKEAEDFIQKDPKTFYQYASMIRNSSSKSV